MLLLTSSCPTHAQLPAEAREIARQLNTHLGPSLVALLANVSDRKLPRQWAEGEALPTDSSKARLDAGHRTWREIASAETDHVARAWFVGTNPQLDDLTPIEALRLGRIDQVLAAASQFVAVR
jgi:hypothetical protein